MQWNREGRFALALLAAAVSVGAAAPKATKPAVSADPGYHRVQTLPVGGEGGWDYLTADSAARRLYVTRGTHVMVLDLDTNKVVGDIPNRAGVHGVALAPELGKGFISNGRSNEVTVFDPKTLKVLQTVKVTGENPDAILYDPATQRVFAFNGRSGNATVLDATTNAVAGTIPLGGKPEFAQSDLKGKVFVNIEDKSEVAEIDAKKLTVLARWPLKPCEEPSGMAIDRKDGRLLIGCSNKLAAVVDTATGKVVRTLPIGSGVDANGFDPGTGLGFSSNGEGNLTIFAQEGPGNFRVAESIATERGARTMAVDEKTHNVYLATAKFNPPPAPTAEQPHPRPVPVPGSFELLVVWK